MERNQYETLFIEKLVHGGAGLSRVDGQVVLVPFVIPGERVRVRLVKRQRGVWWGEVVELLEAALQRTRPRCPLFGVCGGCDFQHIAYGHQRQLKREIVAETLARTGGADMTLNLPEASPPFGYRNRVILHRAQAMEFGFHQRRSSKIVPVEQCPVAAYGINRFLQDVRSGEILSSALPPVRNGRVTVFGDEERYALADTTKHVDVNVLGKSLRVHLKAFFQSNLTMLESMISYISDDLHGGRCVDLYGGIGLYSAFLPEKFDQITVVEKNRAAIEAARKNVPQAHIRCQDADAWVAAEGAACSADTIIVNPPRTGLTPTVRQWLIEKPVSTLVYVSCDPATLGRDLGYMLDSYTPSDVRLFDMYPQTGHVETVVKLSMTAM